MIGRLTGRIVHEEATGAVMLDVHGVGYELTCPLGTLGRAQGRATGALDGLTLYVHTHLRQDSLELFGFSSLEERAAFRLLTTVPNVGPRLALSVLNVFAAAELGEAIDNEDKVRLSKVPGVGKKTAERLVLELRGKLPRKLAGSDPGDAPGAREVPGDLPRRLTAALTSLGYKPSEAERAASALTPEDHQKDLATVLREGLKYLSS